MRRTIAGRNPVRHAACSLPYRAAPARAEKSPQAPGCYAPGVNREKRILWVRQGKGRKDRVVPAGQRALGWVEKYIEDVRPLLAADPAEQALFLTGYGQAFSEDVLGRRVHEYIGKAGVAREMAGAHLLRHTCATHMLEGGADIRFIQQLLGHEKLETTAIYTEVNIDQLQAVHARTHPAESAGKRPAMPQ